MPLFSRSELPEFDITRGLHARAVHAESLTVLHVQIDKGTLLPEHAHFHEQVLNLIEGELELTVGDETFLLRPGHILVIPSNAVHRGRAISDCYVIDIFHPVREDFKSGKFSGYPSDSNR